jgi:hydroxyacylglutathione hydrolase
MMKKGGDQFVLDVRDDDEFTGEGLKHATHIHLPHLLKGLDEILRDQPVFPLCRSGNRAMLAVSVLKREGWNDVNFLMGGLSAWRAYACEFDL